MQSQAGEVMTMASPPAQGGSPGWAAPSPQAVRAKAMALAAAGFSTVGSPLPDPRILPQQGNRCGHFWLRNTCNEGDRPLARSVGPSMPAVVLNPNLAQ